MHESVRLYLLAIETTENAREIENYLSAEAMKKKFFPKNVRPASTGDIEKGAVLYYHNGDNGDFFEVVEEVFVDGWYCGAITGCNYNLDGAFVEEK